MLQVLYAVCSVHCVLCNVDHLEMAVQLVAVKTGLTLVLLSPHLQGTELAQRVV